MLFVSDLFYPGWKAYLDGKKTNIYTANYAFRAIEVPVGKHEVKFVYRPDSFNTGLKITGFSFLLLILSIYPVKEIGKKVKARYT
jgi:uncharacterized membrane protein YfhO